MVWKRDAIRDNCSWEPEPQPTPWWVDVVAALAVTALLFAVMWWGGGQ